MLARHGRRLLNLLDDTPVVPGDTRPTFEHGAQARQVLNDAEEDLREWTPNLEPVHSAATEMGSNLMPTQAGTAATSDAGEQPMSPVEGSALGATETPTQRDVSGSSTLAHPEPSQSYQAQT